MAVTTTTRLGVTRWSAGTDPFTRAQMDGGHAQLEALAGLFGQNTAALRPAAAAANQGMTFLATDTGALSYSDGTTWHAFATQFNGGAVASQIAVNVDTPASGATYATSQAIAFGSRGGLMTANAGGTQAAGSGIGITDNMYATGTAWASKLASASRSGLLWVNDGGFGFYNTPAPGAADTTLTLTSRFNVDYSGNGTLVGNLQAVVGSFSSSITTPGSVAGRSDGTAGVAFIVGNDTTINDVNIGNTIGIIGLGDNSQGGIKFGATTGPQILGTLDGRLAVVSGTLYEGSARVYSANNPPPVSGMNILATTPIAGATLTGTETAIVSFVAPSSGLVNIIGNINYGGYAFFVGLVNGTPYYQLSNTINTSTITASGLSPGATYTVYGFLSGLPANTSAAGVYVTVVG